MPPLLRQLITLPFVLLLVAALAITALTGSLLLMAALLLSPLLLPLWWLLFYIKKEPDETLSVRTGDNRNLTMLTYGSKNRPGPPVLLCHGLATNHYSLDLNERFSLARHLAAKGHRVYLLSLRGTAGDRLRRGEIHFDQFVELDLPAAIDFVCRRESQKKLHWVGHSMGAMVAYGLLAKRLPTSRKLASLTAMAAPGSVDHMKLPYIPLLRRVPSLLEWIDSRAVVQAAIPALGHYLTPMENQFYSSDHVGGRQLRRYLFNGIEVIPSGLMRQFLSWIENREATNLDGSFNYQKELRRINLPVLFIAGSHDQLAPPSSVAAVYQAASSRTKKMLLFGRNNGYKSDYCHIGLLIGNHAPEEVYPEVEAWISSVNRRQKRSRK